MDLSRTRLSVLIGALLFTLCLVARAQQPADKPADKPAPKPADRPAAKAAQQPADRPVDGPAEEPPASLFGEQIEVRVINVEAVVTDKQGRRVPDLKPADFRLKIDGKVVPIEYFTEVRGGSAIAPDAASPSSIKGLPSLAPGTPVGTSYLVFVDDFFSVAARRNEVLRALKDSLSRLGPEDRMAIVAFDGRKAEMLSSWSSSQRQLGLAIEAAIGRSAQGVARLAELRSFETSRRLTLPSTFEPSPRAAFADRLDIEERSYAERLGDQVERVVGAAVGTLRGFASPPGRKVMLLFSGGWPFSPVDFVINNPNRPVLERDLPRGEDLYRPLIDTANRLGYTLYPVDVPGLETDAVDASQASPAPGGLNIREQENQSTLLVVAQQTGGRALINGLRSASLDNAAEDTRSYYWMGFTPSWKGDDAHHRMVVEMVRPDLKVRTRDSFQDLSRKAEVSMMVESAMMFGGAPGMATMPMQLGKPISTGRREMQVPITLAIPASSFSMVPIAGKFAAELELRVAVVDENGNRADIPVIPLALSAAEAPPQGSFVKYETKIKMRKLGHHMIVAIYDPLLGKITTAEADVRPPK
jgi:VWFA-related protein